jgi:hypothetical protein
MLTRTGAVAPTSTIQGSRLAPAGSLGLGTQEPSTARRSKLTPKRADEKGQIMYGQSARCSAMLFACSQKPFLRNLVH